MHKSELSRKSRLKLRTRIEEYEYALNRHTKTPSKSSYALFFRIIHRARIEKWWA